MRDSAPSTQYRVDEQAGMWGLSTQHLRHSGWVDKNVKDSDTASGTGQMGRQACERLSTTLSEDRGEEVGTEGSPEGQEDDKS